MESPASPVFGPNNFVADTAYVCGNITFGRDCNIWPGVVMRGDVAPIRIGDRVNIQDLTMVHTKSGVPLEIEDDVAFGHRAVAHCKRIGSESLIGIGSVVLDEAEIGPGCLVAAGAVVTPGTIIPAGKVVMGTPAKVIREVRTTEREYMKEVVENYQRLSKAHRDGDFPRRFPTPEPSREGKPGLFTACVVENVVDAHLLIERLQRKGVYAEYHSDSAATAWKPFAVSILVHNPDDVGAVRDTLGELYAERTISKVRTDAPEDARCYECGYSLQGHQGQGACPECGHPFISIDHKMINCENCQELVPDNFEACWNCGRAMQS